MTLPPAALPDSARGAITTLLAGAAAAMMAVATAVPALADPPPAPAPPPLDAVTRSEPVVLAEERVAAAPLPLTAGSRTDRPAAAGRSPLRPLGDWTVLLAVAAAFALVAAFRFTSLRRAKSLPRDVFELLGEASLGGQHTARVVRFGPRTLLIGVSSAGCQTLAELDDPQATERIALACRSEPAAARSTSPDLRPRPAARPAGGEAA